MRINRPQTGLGSVTSYATWLLILMLTGFCSADDGADHAIDSSPDISAACAKLGRGVNLGNFFEVPRDQNWGVKLSPDHLGLIKQAGFDSIRLPVKWSDYAATDKPYTIEPEFFERVDRWLDRAEAEQLNVVLNIHHYDGLDKDPAAHTDRFAALWTQIAEHYRSRGDWLYFELDNEPHDKLVDHWNDVLLRGLAAVRASNPTRPVIIGPPHWNGIWALPQLKLPDDKNLIVTVHMYNPHEFTHQGALWAGDKVRAIKNKAWGSDKELAALKREMKQAADWGREHERPIYLGEFGAYEAAPQDSRVRWTAAVTRTAEELEMSWAYWEFGAGFGVYDLANKQWHDDLLHALIP